MTNFLRYAYMSLVAYATLAIILMIAVAARAEDVKPSAETNDGTRQIMVEEPKGKDATPAPEKITLAKGEDTAVGEARGQQDSGRGRFKRYAGRERRTRARGPGHRSGSHSPAQSAAAAEAPLCGLRSPAPRWATAIAAPITTATERIGKS
jgi:hypothetical protein